jgi:hypothetical protein
MQGHAVVPGLENPALPGPSRQDCDKACPASGGAGEPQKVLALCGRLAAGPPSSWLSCLQVIGACVHACDLGAGSCDDRRIRQVIGGYVLSAPRYPALCSL